MFKIWNPFKWLATSSIPCYVIAVLELFFACIVWLTALLTIVEHDIGIRHSHQKTATAGEKTDDPKTADTCKNDDFAPGSLDAMLRVFCIASLFVWLIICYMLFAGVRYHLPKLLRFWAMMKGIFLLMMWIAIVFTEIVEVVGLIGHKFDLYHRIAYSIFTVWSILTLWCVLILYQEWYPKSYRAVNPAGGEEGASAGKEFVQPPRKA